MPSQKPKFQFLSLPPEARLRINESVLVSKPQVIPDRRPAADPPVAPPILRTCKRIHSEASPFLYSTNTFLIAEPERILKWFEQIGRTNIVHLKSVRIFVHGVYSTKEIPFLSIANTSLHWYKVLDRLAREATGSRHVYICWDAEESCGHHGAGKDVHFVRELAKIQGLQSMAIDGFYAMHWPRYLAEKMGVLIKEDPSQSLLLHLRKYQRGMENLGLVFAGY